MTGLAGEATLISNHIRGLIAGIRPALERAVGRRSAIPLSSRSCPVSVARPGSGTTLAVKHAPCMGTRLAEEISPPWKYRL
ncbi:hypothetical protein J2X34_005744 [Rhodococcus sp. BE178]